ncbi:hypothetical protein CEXT_251341 [Caerostris extrusa]|uniref:Uncharacterized protein n=1 Tax=Caerostris extrusa TaxID=172846 RepID=A0AAV4QF40_CAEEX|nr:hypothetical protein CEXT_251341 [Caerostris extrusa]
MWRHIQEEQSLGNREKQNEKPCKMNFTFSVAKDPLAALKRAGRRVSPREAAVHRHEVLWASWVQKQRHSGGQFDGSGIGSVSVKGAHTGKSSNWAVVS